MKRDNQGVIIQTFIELLDSDGPEIHLRNHVNFLTEGISAVIPL